MPPATETQNRAKRRADCDPEGEPPVKKFGLLQLGPANSPDSARNDGPVDESPMLLDDTKHTTYIYDIDRELAGIEEEEKHNLFIPDIEKALNAIPRAVLHDRPKPENELVLYGIPRSLTVAEEDKDAVRKAIIESRARAKTHSALRAESDDSMADHFDRFFFTSNLSSYVCPGFQSFQCPPPNACARDSTTGIEYCCDYGDVCWGLTTDCATDGTTLSCGDGQNTWCCRNDTEVCTGTSGQINICWNSAHDTLTNISSNTLNETYSSLSSASPSASSWSFSPETLIAATQTTSSSTTSTTTTTTTSASKHTTALPTSTHTSTPSSTESSSSSSSSSLSGGAIAGIVIGALAGVAIIAALAFFLFRRRRNSRDPSDSNPNVRYEPVVYGSVPKVKPAPEQAQVLSELPTSAQRSELQGSTPHELAAS
ncbi:hypothetical protein PISL3812_09275 [Talaromyces islandicus]|uniref:Uncharacterized protein n=1 Tax=Talaromyces islandicus TaxID=28573 RepID=A0A0U1M9I7_TALIS|nr:hypothetical protein PISL3812_09275 [Talaromyces islandicus]